MSVSSTARVPAASTTNSRRTTSPMSGACAGLRIPIETPATRSELSSGLSIVFSVAAGTVELPRHFVGLARERDHAACDRRRPR